MNTARLGHAVRDHALVLKDVVEGDVRRLAARLRADDALPDPPRMAFIIGCGRSGTTILGRCLGAHSRVAYLNEPQHMWFAGWPEGDVWSPFATMRGGKLAFSAEDATCARKQAVVRIMTEALRGERDYLVEKWPINAFRVALLAALFPRAKFIYLRRDPFEVAASIEAAVARDGTWWGAFDYKWRALVSYARLQAYDRTPIEAACDHFERGLIEWRLSTDAAEQAFTALAPDLVLTVDYDRFVQEPAVVGARILAHLGLPPCPAFDAMMARDVRRPPSSQRPRRATSDRHRAILGSRNPFASRA